jgi:hypothetical protein
MNCNPSFSPPWQLDGTDSPSTMVQCQAEQKSRTLPTDAERTVPHCGDDEAFADRLQRAWQKMLDDELTFGGDWTSEIDGGSRG